MQLRAPINSIAVCFAGLLCCLGFSAQAAAIDWNLKTECVGRYQINVPGDSQYPLASYKELNGHALYKFTDGLVGSQEIKYGDIIHIGDGTRQADFELLKATVEKRMQSRKRDLLSINHKEDADHIAMISITIPDAFAVRYGEGIGLYFLRKGYIFHKSFSGMQDNFDANLKIMQDFIASFRLRSIFDIPAENGVCFPFGFVADNGEINRDVTVDFRPKSHPDVVITFEDNLAEWNDPQTNNKHLLTSLFENFSSERPELGIRRVHSQKFDGREGYAAFARLHRKNGDKDFLYIALVTGTDKSGKSTPTLMLRVERIARYAKGQPPISESEFRSLAEDVLNSIQRRPTAITK